MGNNPSRTPTHSHQHQHLHQHHSTPTSPPTANVPARAASTSSSRTRINRRNSLQQAPPARYPTTPSASAPPEHALLPVGPRNDDSSSSEAWHSQGRRESTAEAIPATPWTIDNVAPRPPSAFHRVGDDDDVLTSSPVARKHPTASSTPTTTATLPGGDDLSSRTGTPLSSGGGPHADPVVLSKRGSMGSTTTVDEDEVDVADTRTIPTLIQWSQPGHKVCVTGTFSNWRRRFKLNRSIEDEFLSAVVPLPPGTHHLKFFVDGEMRTSDDLPTAVDDTGILVNYLEVNADDMPPLDRQSSPPSPTSSHRRQRQQPPASANLLTSLSKKNKRYTNDIPPYLREFDDTTYDDNSGNSRRIGNEDGDIPAPPSLPMMLQKVILNTNSTMKDDASVLGIPNHVVLNHLATSSIKNQVLAVSATTRYRKKYVTTILYKATTE